MFAAGRLTQAAGARNYLPAFLDAAAGSTADGQIHNHNKQPLWGIFSRLYPFPNTTKDQNIPMYVHMHATEPYGLFFSSRD
jgi:hypothetical protein